MGGVHQLPGSGLKLAISGWSGPERNGWMPPASVAPLPPPTGESAVSNVARRLSVASSESAAERRVEGHYAAFAAGLPSPGADAWQDSRHLRVPSAPSTLHSEPPSVPQTPHVVEHSSRGTGTRFSQEDLLDDDEDDVVPLHIPFEADTSTGGRRSSAHAHRTIPDVLITPKASEARSLPGQTFVPPHVIAKQRLDAQTDVGDGHNFKRLPPREL
jgi:hypothetical protein